MFVFFRLLLWDLDERRYSYYIEVSCDQQNWVRVVDKTKEACRWESMEKLRVSIQGKKKTPSTQAKGLVEISSKN